MTQKLLITAVLIATLGGALYAGPGKSKGKGPTADPTKPQRKMRRAHSPRDMLRAMNDPVASQILAIRKIKQLTLQAERSGVGADVLMKVARKAQQPAVKRAAIFAASEVFEKAGNYTQAVETLGEVFRVQDRRRRQGQTGRRGGQFDRRGGGAARGEVMRGIARRMRGTGRGEIPRWAGQQFSGRQGASRQRAGRGGGGFAAERTPYHDQARQFRRARQWMQENPQLARGVVGSLVREKFANSRRGGMGLHGLGPGRQLGSERGRGFAAAGRGGHGRRQQMQRRGGADSHRMRQHNFGRQRYQQQGPDRSRFDRRRMDVEPWRGKQQQWQKRVDRLSEQVERLEKTLRRNIEQTQKAEGR